MIIVTVRGQLQSACLEIVIGLMLVLVPDYFERIRDIIATHRCGGIITAPMWLSPIVKQTGITFLLGTTGTETNKVEIGSRTGLSSQ